MAPKLNRAAKRKSHLVALPSTIHAERDIAYGRVSSDKQREDQTIEVQKTLLVTDITARDRDDLPVAEQRKLVGQFWDDPCSGTVAFEDRPEGGKLIRMICQRGDIDCKGTCNTPPTVDAVWVSKLDRVARKLSIVLEFVSFLEAHNVRLRCLDLNVDTRDRNGRLMLQLLAMIAEWERETILERTGQGRLHKVLEGKVVGGRPTVGYKTVEGRLVVDEPKAAIVREIFENVAFHDRTAMQEAQRTGWTHRKVLNVLHNPRYRGETGMWSNGEWISSGRNGPEAIVSSETWNLVQTKLTENQSQSSRNRKNDYILSSLLICCEPHTHVDVFHEDGSRLGRPVKTPGMCGRLFLGRTEHRRKTNYVYYYCSREGDCSAKPLRGRDAEAAVWKVVADAQRHPEEFVAETFRNVDQSALIHSLRSDIVGITDFLARLEAERGRVVQSWERGNRTEHQMDLRLAEIAAETEPLEVRKLALERQLHSVTVSASNLRRAEAVEANVKQRIDEIERMCSSHDPAVVSKGKQQKAALIRATVEYGEVRVVEGRSHIRLFLRFGSELPVEIPSSKETDNYRQQPLVIMHEIVMPLITRGRPKGGYPSERGVHSA